MEKEIKITYEAPSASILDVKIEGVICESDVKTNGSPTYNGFNDEEEW